MTIDCSLIYNFSTRKIQVKNMLYPKTVFCFGIQNNFRTQHVLNLYFSRTDARMCASEADLPVKSGFKRLTVKQGDFKNYLVPLGMVSLRRHHVRKFFSSSKKNLAFNNQLWACLVLIQCVNSPVQVVSKVIYPKHSINTDHILWQKHLGMSLWSKMMYYDLNLGLFSSPLRYFR